MRDVRVPLPAILALSAWLTLSGCDSLHKVKSENPVFPPPPPRLSMSNEGSRTKVAAQSDDPKDEKPGTARTALAGRSEVNPTIQPAGLSEADKGPRQPKLDDTEVVATVNGQPIFASEILERYGPQLALAKQQASPEEMKTVRESLLRRDLPGHIERKILVQSLRSTLKPEQVKMLQGHLDKMFEGEIERLKKQMKVNTRQELDQKLQHDGTSLESLRTTFMNQRMAMEYLVAKSKYDRKIGRRELHDYYEAHEKEYSFPEQVKWQQMLVFYDRHGGKDKAYQDVLKKALDELSSGAEFTAVAKKYSDAENKVNGGLWDWMPRGSLDDEAVEEALFTLPVGSVSKVFVGKKSYQLVKLLDRKEAGVQPFEDLQDEIRQKVELDARRAASLKLLDDLRSKAHIESPYVDAPKGR